MRIDLLDDYTLGALTIWEIYGFWTLLSTLVIMPCVGIPKCIEVGRITRKQIIADKNRLEIK